tara:strand:- start:489 stop:788 length:300 start_codon:yes stop_codon:yes gene_type:complete
MLGGGPGGRISGGGGGGGSLFRSISEPDAPPSFKEDPDSKLPPSGEVEEREGLVEGVVAPPSLAADVEPMDERLLAGDEIPVEGDDATGGLKLFIGRGT